GAAQLPGAAPDPGDRHDLRRYLAGAARALARRAEELRHARLRERSRAQARDPGSRPALARVADGERERTAAVDPAHHDLQRLLRGGAADGGVGRSIPAAGVRRPAAAVTTRGRDEAVV